MQCKMPATSPAPCLPLYCHAFRDDYGLTLYGGLNRYGPCKLLCLKAWPLGVEALLEELCHCSSRL
ncbi:hypothetical protein ACRRTK_008860 [Alexandromys fortis]